MALLHYKMDNKNVPHDQLPNTSSKSVAKLFNTSWISNNLLFFFYIAFLAIIYIAYGHWTDKTIRNINKTEAKIKDLQFEYKTSKAAVMKAGEVKNIAIKANELGLEMSTTMPIEIQRDSIITETKD
jgi:Tfp pilus assembly protein PilO